MHVNKRLNGVFPLGVWVSSHLPVVIAALCPSDKAEQGQDLWLDAQGNIKLLSDVVDAQGHASPGPEHHHGWLKANGVVTPVVHNYLRDQLLEGLDSSVTERIG